jgi:Mo-dependent nitrogenase C-terminus
MNTLLPSFQHPASDFDLLKLLKQWLDQLEIHDRRIAQRIVRLIPAQCPFEHDINCFGRSIVHIPPLCQLNPIYEQLAELRFRALCCLAEEWGEDISAYC